MATGANTGSRLQELDALRGIGALAVIVFHYSTRFHAIFPTAAHVPFEFIGGNYRVLLFFAISGFAIFFTLERVKSIPDFIVNRVARLYPAYWVAILLTLSVEYLGRVTALEIPARAVIANFSMLEGFVFMPAVDGAYWTLTVEIAFYVSMMLVWLGPWRKRMEPMLLIWLACKWLLFVWPGMPERVVMLLILRYVPFFAIGMLYYRLWSGQRSVRQQAPYALAVLVTIGVIETPDLLIAALLLFACFGAMVRGWLRFLCVRPLLWVGGISYSLYLVHQHIGFVIMLKASQWGLNPWGGAAIALVAALTIGWMLNRWVERPGHRLIEKWWRARGRRVFVPAPSAPA